MFMMNCALPPLPLRLHSATGGGSMFACSVRLLLYVKAFSCWLVNDWDVLKHIRRSCYKGVFNTMSSIGTGVSLIAKILHVIHLYATKRKVWLTF